MIPISLGRVNFSDVVAYIIDLSQRPPNLSRRLLGAQPDSFDERVGGHAVGDDAEEHGPTGCEHDRVVTGKLCVEDKDPKNDCRQPAGQTSR